MGNVLHRHMLAVEGVRQTLFVEPILHYNEVREHVVRQAMSAQWPLNELG